FVQREYVVPFRPFHGTRDCSCSRTVPRLRLWRLPVVSRLLQWCRGRRAIAGIQRVRLPPLFGLAILGRLLWRASIGIPLSACSACNRYPRYCPSSCAVVYIIRHEHAPPLLMSLPIMAVRSEERRVGNDNC